MGGCTRGPSKAFMMCHFGGVLGGWVYKRVGWVSHLLPPKILLFNCQRAPSFGCKRGNPNYELNLHWDDPKEPNCIVEF